VSFDQSYLLLGLLAVPILLAAYLWQTRRRKPAAVRYSNVALVRTAVGPSRRWRRHLPVALVIASLGLLGVAAARPQVKADVPISSSTVILALDVSGSMCATDVEPNRLSAAQAAGLAIPETLVSNDPARIRAMYTDPDFTRQGVGRMVLQLCEDAARCAGFRSATMMATMAGVPLYRACGYVEAEPPVTDNIDGVDVPLVRMEKRFD